LHCMRLSCFKITLLVGSLFWLMSASTAHATPKLSVDYREVPNFLFFTLSSDAGDIKQSQLTIKLLPPTKKDKGSLLLVEVKNIVGVKRWLKSFKDSTEKDAVKGVMVRAKGSDAQIRIRFDSKRGDQLKKAIKITPSLGKLVVKIPTRITKNVRPRVATTKTAPPSMKPNKELTSSLSPRIKSATDHLRDSPLPPKNLLVPTPVKSAFNTNKAKSAGNSPTLTPTGRGGVLTPPTVAPPSRQPPPVQTRQPPVRNVNSNNRNRQMANRSAGKPVQSNSFKRTFSKPQNPRKDLKAGSQKDRRTSSIGASTGSNNTVPQTDIFEGFGDLPWELMLGGLFMLAISLWIYKGARKASSDQLEPSIRIIAEKVVNYKPVQRILVVEVLDQTLVVGSSHNAGLSLLGQIPPAQRSGSRGNSSRYDDSSAFPKNTPPKRDRGGYGSSRSAESDHKNYSSYDEQFNNSYTQEYDDAYNRTYDEDYNSGYERPVTSETNSHEYPYDPRVQPDAQMMNGYDEATYREELHTGDFPQLGSSRGLSADERATTEQPIVDPLLDPARRSESLGDLSSLIDEVEDSRYSTSDVRSSSSASDIKLGPTSSDSTPGVDEDVSADDLLQKIRQLNRG
jgi:hypothetical protein